MINVRAPYKLCATDILFHFSSSSSSFFLLPSSMPLTLQLILCHGENHSSVLVKQSEVYLIMPRAQMLTHCHWNHLRILTKWICGKSDYRSKANLHYFMIEECFFHSFLYLLIPLFPQYLCRGMEDNKKINGTWLPSDNLYFNKGDKMIKSNPKCWPDGWIQTIPDFMGSRRLPCLTFITGVGTRYSRAQSSMKVRIRCFFSSSSPSFSIFLLLLLLLLSVAIQTNKLSEATELTSKSPWGLVSPPIRIFWSRRFSL